jgi:PBSX family phage portal protein
MSTDQAIAAPVAAPHAFTFGDPVPVLDRRELLDYIECPTIGGRWYETPVSFDGLAKTLRSSPHHSSAIYVKRNILAASFIPHRMLSREQFTSWALDFLVFGNGYLERRDAISGRPMELRASLAKYTRRGVVDGEYFFVQGYRNEHAFKPGSVFHLLEPDVHQEIYGLPEYMSALQSALLNESSTLFRRKYYVNGSHAGYILYVSDPSQSPDDIEAIRTALREAKGPGNFRNLFLYSPNGKKDGVQVIPVSEVAAKDEFLGIKDATRDDILAAHRVPPALLGIVPKNTGGFGSPQAAAAVFVKNELEPLQHRFAQLNEWLGTEVVRFAPYRIELPAT